MKKLVSILLTAACLSLSATSFTSCQSTGGVGGVVSSAQSWLQDPKNQALIQEIAQTATVLIGALGRHSDASINAAVGKLSTSYPDVPAGALRKIVSNPSAYRK